MKRSSPARILNVASKGLLLFPRLTIEFDNLDGRRRYSTQHAYYHSKLAQVMFTCDLAERLVGSGVTVNCIRVTNVQIDPARLTQVLTNMVGNAIKFSSPGGLVEVSAAENGPLVQVQVSDNGMGIRKEDLKRVFEPFAAIEKPTYVKGTGLGLSVSKGLVEAHGGKIWAESPGEGKGVTFTFTLPKNSADHLLAQPSNTPTTH